MVLKQETLKRREHSLDLEPGCLNYLARSAAAFAI